MAGQWTELADYRVNRHPYAQRMADTVARIAKRGLSFTDGDTLGSFAKLQARSGECAAACALGPDFPKLRQAQYDSDEPFTIKPP
jgi:hypothetical protein